MEIENQFVLAHCGELQIDDETWRKILARWEERGRRLLSVEDVADLVIETND